LTAATIAVNSPFTFAFFPASIALGIATDISPANNPTIEITTSNSTNVKPVWFDRFTFF